MTLTKDRPLSAVMAIVLAETIEHGGKLVRHQGGYWSYPGCPLIAGGGALEWYAGTTTVNALVVRGRFKYTEWQQGRKDRFPIAVEVVTQPEEAEAA